MEEGRKNSTAGRTKKLRKVEDYDDGSLPSTYEMGNIITIMENALYVGPIPTTRRQRLFLEKRLGTLSPALVALEFPDLTERRLWKPDESARFFAEYARTLHRTWAKGPVYVYYKTGCEEEVIMAALLWALRAPDQVPKTEEAWKEWRTSNAYLWIWDDRLDETVHIVHAAAQQLSPATSGGAGSAGVSLMSNWLRRSAGTTVKKSDEK